LNLGIFFPPARERFPRTEMRNLNLRRFREPAASPAPRLHLLTIH